MVIAVEYFDTDLQQTVAGDSCLPADLEAGKKLFNTRFPALQHLIRNLCLPASEQKLLSGEHD